MRLDERRLMIRADASAEMGTGHVMRCLALAQAWKDSGGQATFVTACGSKGLIQRLQQEGFAIHPVPAMHPDARDWATTQAILSRFKDSWVVVDGYHFDEAYQQRVKEAGNKLLVIGSMTHRRNYHGDILLNAGLNAERIQYSCAPYTRLLLGPKYLLIRREFLVWTGWKRSFPAKGRQLLVTLGGSAPHSTILRVIRVIQNAEIPGLHTTVVAGPASCNGEPLPDVLSQFSVPLRLVCDPPDMSGIMAEADLAITGGGTTAWELSFMGLPMLMIVMAENQRNTAATMQRAGIAESLGWHEDLDCRTVAQRIKDLLDSPAMRASLSQAQRKTVDGMGASRVIAEMKDLCER